MLRGLHYGVIDPRSSWTGDASLARREFDVTFEPQADIGALRATGERSQVENKRQPPETIEQGGKVLNTAAAFQHSEGCSAIVLSVNRAR